MRWRAGARRFSRGGHRRNSPAGQTGASIILEFTDSLSFLGCACGCLSETLEAAEARTYAFNRLRRRKVIGLCHDNGLTASALYRYGLPPLGTSKVAGQEEMYQMTRYLFGPSDRNRNAWMGNQFIYRLQKAIASPAL